MLKDKIIPELLTLHPVSDEHRQQMEENEKDKWDESLFENHTVSTTFGTETMKLHEKNFYSGKNNKYYMREIRRLCTDGHQTSIVDELEQDIKVVNVEYNNLSYHIKKEREKLKRQKADLYELERN